MFILDIKRDSAFLIPRAEGHYFFVIGEQLLYLTPEELRQLKQLLDKGVSPLKET